MYMYVYLYMIYISIYLYVYICIFISTYICIYIYIYLPDGASRTAREFGGKALAKADQFVDKVHIFSNSSSIVIVYSK